MNTRIEAEYYSAGGNRQSGAADWSTSTGHLAFGAGHNVGIWSPLNDSGRGISALLNGHKAKVTTVKFSGNTAEQSRELLITGSADGEVATWRQDDVTQQWLCLDKQNAHDGAINTIAGLDHSDVFVTGGADAKVKVWKVEADKIESLITLPLKPRSIPLTLAVGLFASDQAHNSAFLVVGGTRNDIQIYSIEKLSTNPHVKLCATLTGHEAWIRSLALTPTSDGGFLLASASQDKYVRIWRFRSDEHTSLGSPSHPNGWSTTTSSLTAKVQSVSVGENTFTISFEALLLGHEDWIYSAAWSSNTPGTTPQLLTASADGSLSIWEVDPASGIWISISRLGEISGQKGSTTATGSAGGFWIGLWGPDGKTVTCLGRTGSWRLWQYNENSQFWSQRHGISGHVGAVNGLCWSPCGGYLLSTSSDQTTRLHAEWKRGQKRSWHEFSRPQIHGYDLNCIASTSPHQFCSGADEKLLRVFNEPRDVANMLHRLCGVSLPGETAYMPETAAVPALGLSNKAIEDETVETTTNGAEATDDGSDAAGNQAANGLHASLLDIDEPPPEDLLARHTLWPEHEKLYGHGSEISEVATPSSKSTTIATACKASSLEHAVVRLYDTKTWSEIKPPLSAHSLTVTRLSFSPDGKYLLSVGRDRQWAVFKRTEEELRVHGAWTRIANNLKAHSRMILDASWLDGPEQPTFVTAGRDKNVKIWSRTSSQGAEHDNFAMKASIARKSPVSSISATFDGRHWILAVGEDDGSLSLHNISVNKEEVTLLRSLEVPKGLCPSRTVNRLAWRPGGLERDDRSCHLAVASADDSVRILNVTLEVGDGVGGTPA